MKKVLLVILVFLSSHSFSQSSLGVSYYLSDEVITDYPDRSRNNNKIGLDFSTRINDNNVIGIGATLGRNVVSESNFSYYNSFSTYITYGKIIDNMEIGTKMGVGFKGTPSVSGNKTKVTYLGNYLTGLFLNLRVTEGVYLSSTYDNFNGIGFGVTFGNLQYDKK